MGKKYLIYSFKLIGTPLLLFRTILLPWQALALAVPVNYADMTGRSAAYGRTHTRQTCTVSSRRSTQWWHGILPPNLKEVPFETTVPGEYLRQPEGEDADAP